MPDINVRRDQFPPDPPRTPARLNDHEAVRSCMQPGCRNTFVADARVEQHYCGYADCAAYPSPRPPAPPRITDHAFRSGRDVALCGFLYWQAAGKHIECDQPEQDHQSNQQPRPEAPYRTGLDAPVCATCGQPTAPGSGAFLHDRCTTLPQPLMTSLERQQAAELAHYRELEDVFSGIDTKYQTACDEIERLKALAVRAREFAVQCAYATAAGLPAQQVAAKHLIGLLDDEEAGHRG